MRLLDNQTKTTLYTKGYKNEKTLGLIKEKYWDFNVNKLF